MIVKVSSITEPYFSHDYSTREKKEIKKIIQDMGFEGYGLYWAIVEFMYRNKLMPGEESLVVDKNYATKVKDILTNYGLFHIENGFYISDRIIKTIEKQEEKSKRAKQAVDVRWLLADFDKEYEKVFGTKPILEDTEIETLKKLNKKIPDLKSKLPAIFATLSRIKFDTEIGFIPRVNWLLNGNNMYQIINGQYGKLENSLSEHEKNILKKQYEEFKEKVENFDISQISNKIDAIDFIVRGNTERQLFDCHNQLIKKFDISKKELGEYWEQINHA